MISHSCPNCDHEFHTSDELAGMPIQCWNCHQTVEVPRPAIAETGAAVATAVQSPPARPGTEEEVGLVWAVNDFFRRLKGGELFRRQAEDPPHRGHCTLCDEPGAEVSRRFLRVYVVTNPVLFALARRLTVQVWACNPCRRKGTLLGLMWWLSLAAIVGLVVLAFLAGNPLSKMLEQSQSMSPEVARAVGLMVFIAPLAVACVLPFLIMLWLPRRTRTLVNRDADVRLRQLAGVEKWGMFTAFRYVRRRRAGEHCEHL